MARVFVPPERLTGNRVVLDGEPYRHLARVLRAQPGTRVTVFDGAGTEIAAEVAMVTRKALELVLGARSRVEPSATRITLLQGIPHGDRMEMIIQKTTELGVARIVPVITDRTVPRVRGDRGTGKQKRWQTIAREAARQCGRADLPEIDAPVDLPEAAARFGSPESRIRCLVLWEEARGPSLASAVARSDTDIRLAVGPEGGLSQNDVDTLTAAGFATVTVGPRVLRVETAAIVAVALALNATGGLG